METFEKEIIEITDADKLEPTSILVEIYRIVIDEETGKKERELFKTIEYKPKRYTKKRLKK